MKNYTEIFQLIAFYTKKVIDAKPFRIWFDKFGEIIKTYDGIK